MDGKKNGCGLLFTSPATHNDIVAEFAHHAIVRHAKTLQVIDDIAKELRDMTDTELLAHTKQVDDAVQRQLGHYKKLYPKNNFTAVRLQDDGNHSVHEFQVERVEGVVQESVIDGKTHYTLYCPGCNKEAYDVYW